MLVRLVAPAPFLSWRGDDMIPHATVSCETYEVVNLSVWDRKSEWSPEPGFFVVRLDDQIVQPSIGWVWNPHTRTFGFPVDNLPSVSLIGDLGKPAIAKPNFRIDPIRDIPHRQVNWLLCDRGQQSDKIFQPKAEVEEIYRDRMSLPDFQYVVPKNQEASGG